MNGSITFRNVTSMDAPRLDEINRRNLAENYELEDWTFVLKHFSEYCHVAIKEDIIVGYCICIVNNKVATVASLAVDPEYRNNGIGKKLLLCVINSVIDSVKNNVCEITLECRVSNKIAYQLYKNLNFNVTSTIKNYYKNPTEDAYNMKKTLLEKV